MTTVSRRIERAAAPHGLQHPDRHADEKGQRQRRRTEADRHRQCVGQRADDWLVEREAFSEVAVQQPHRPPRILHDERVVQPELRAETRGIGGRRRRRDEKRRGITRSKSDEREGEREHQPE